MAVVITTWTVVLDDGTRPYATDVQIDQRRPLRLVVGETTELRISLVNPVGGVVLLNSGEFLELNLRTLSPPSRPLTAKRSTPMAGNLQKISIAAADTQALTPQSGAFDLWAIRGADRSCIIPLSELRLAPSALGRNYL